MTYLIDKIITKLNNFWKNPYLLKFFQHSFSNIALLLKELIQSHSWYMGSNHFKTKQNELLEIENNKENVNNISDKSKKWP